MYGVPRELILAKLPRVLDSSILSAFRNCQHKALWEYILGLGSSVPNIHFHAGASFARALESLYKHAYNGSASLEQSLAFANFAFERQWGTFTPATETNKTKSRVWDAVESYAQTYSPPSDYIAPSKLFSNPFEYSFAIPLTRDSFGLDFPPHPVYGEPFLFAGRFDMIGEQYGALRIRDDKLVTQLGPLWEKQYTLRGQFIGYVAAMQILGFKIDTVEIRGTQPLKESIQHKTAIKTYSPEVVSRWKEQIARDVWNLVNAALSDDWSFNFSDICSSYGGCPYLDLCRSSEPESYFETYGQRNWNPLEITQ
jgi:hypothetical protein